MTLMYETTKWFKGGNSPSPQSLYEAESMKTTAGRWDYIKKFGFVLLSERLAKDIAKYSPLLEIGAGNGALANRISKYGADIRAVDDKSGDYPFEHEQYYPVEKMSGYAAVWAEPKRTILMAWPSLSQGWANEVLKRMRPDQTIIYIGEGLGGCTADDDFHKNLDDSFEHLHNIDMYQWHGLHDTCQVYRKLSPSQET